MLVWLLPSVKVFVGLWRRLERDCCSVTLMGLGKTSHTCPTNGADRDPVRATSWKLLYRSRSEPHYEARSMKYSQYLVLLSPHEELAEFC